MVLTKEQKIEAYKYCIKYFEAKQRVYHGICWCLQEWIMIRKLDLIVCDTIFSEFFLHKPINTGFVYWWPINEEGRKERIRVLNECIKELESKS